LKDGFHVFWLGLIVSDRDDMSQIFQFGDPESALVEGAGKAVDAQALENRARWWMCSVQLLEYT
jgi:hypothetical protein